MTKTRTKTAPVVIGVGNPDRGDDAAGREVVRRLRGLSAAEARIVEIEGEATAVLARLERAGAVWLIDASFSGAPPGTIRRFDAAATRLPRSAFGISSHGFGLGEALELAETLGMLPEPCVVYAIEGGNFDVGAPLSPDVARAVEEVAERVRREILSFVSAGVGARA